MQIEELCLHDLALLKDLALCCYLVLLFSFVHIYMNILIYALTFLLLHLHDLFLPLIEGGDIFFAGH